MTPMTYIFYTRDALSVPQRDLGFDTAYQVLPTLLIYCSKLSVLVITKVIFLFSAMVIKYLHFLVFITGGLINLSSTLYEIKQGKASLSPL